MAARGDRERLGKQSLWPSQVLDTGGSSAPYWERHQSGQEAGLKFLGGRRGAGGESGGKVRLGRGLSEGLS